MSARRRTGSGGPTPSEEHSDGEREKVMADGQRRADAAAARHREDPAVMEIVDGLLESVPPSESTYVLRLLVHAVDPDEVARENADAIVKDEFLATVRSLLTSPQFKEATSKTAPKGPSVVGIFDSAWRSAMAVKSSGGGNGAS